MAAAGVPLFASLVPDTLPIATEPALDLRVIAFAALFTTLTALGFGLFPAIRAGRRTTFDALREGVRAGGGAKQRLRAVLVTVEVAMSVVLLITSGLLIRAVWRVQAIDPGFRPQNVLALNMALPRPKYDKPLQRVQFYDRVLARVRALPGVQSAAFTSGLPMVINRSRHRGRNPWPGSAVRPQRRRQPSLGHPAVFQDHGDSPAARP